MEVLENKELAVIYGGSKFCDALAGFGLGAAISGLEISPPVLVGLGIAGVGCAAGWW